MNAAQIILVCYALVGIVCGAGLQTDGRWIVDANGNIVHLRCVNWYGFDQKDYVAGGLGFAPLNDIVLQIRNMGFNCVRLPFSLEMVMSNPTITNRTVIARNLDLYGHTALDIYDTVINTLSYYKLAVIVDNHMSDANWCCSNSDENGLWWNARYSEEDWISVWTFIAQRYISNEWVVGYELRNELRQSTISGTTYTPTWGDGNKYTDWMAAATRCGNALLSVNPNILIIVQGINYALDLTGVAKYPVVLSVPNRLVYCAHDYSWSQSIDNQISFNHHLNSQWGYILSLPNPAPVFLDEFGTCHFNTTGCIVPQGSNPGTWYQWILQYIQNNELDWAYWCLDGTESSGTGRVYGQEETFGLLNTTWDGYANSQIVYDLKNL